MTLCNMKGEVMNINGIEYELVKAPSMSCNGCAFVDNNIGEYPCVQGAECAHPRNMIYKKIEEK